MSLAPPADDDLTGICRNIHRLVDAFERSTRGSRSKSFLQWRLFVIRQRPLVSDFIGHEPVEQRYKVPLVRCQLLGAVTIKKLAMRRRMPYSLPGIKEIVIKFSSTHEIVDGIAVALMQ